MNKIKLIATDIDGTILKDNFEFNQEVKTCIKNLTLNGIKVILVTGRMHVATQFIADELGLDTPVVCYQGGLIKHKNEILYEKNLSPKISREIINWAKANKIHLNLYMNDKLYVEKDNEVIRRYATERETDFIVKSFDEINLDRINKMLAIDFDNAKLVSDWENQLKEKYDNLHIVKSTPYFCEICHIDAKKSSAVNFLKEYYGLKKEEILTIGDQNNDIELLSAGGIKVAMGNATDELKEVADYITETVNNNGFVKAVEKFVLDTQEV